MASLALYWSVMIACYLLASRLRRYADRLGFVNTLLSVSVYALVFVMGLRMGANREVTDNLGVIGVQALLVTALTMAFSMLGAFAVRRALHIDRNALPRGAEKTAAMPSAAAHADASGSKTSLIIFAMVAVGMLLGYFVVPRVTDPDAFQTMSGSWLVVGLCLLLAFVGFGMGLEGKLKAMLRGAGLGIVLVPLAMVAGSLLAILGIFCKRVQLLVGGFQIANLDYAGPLTPMQHTAFDSGLAGIYGQMVYWHNVLRETLGIILLPLAASKIGCIEAVTLPGTCAMDVCLPIVERSCSAETLPYSFTTGMAACLFSALLVPLIMGV